MTPANNIHRYQQKAHGCRCEKRKGEEAFGDVRDGTCLTCGHQVDGKPLPARGVFAIVISDNDQSSFAKPTRKYRPAA